MCIYFAQIPINALWVLDSDVCVLCDHLSFLFQMIQEMSSNKKGPPPDMGDLSDVSACI